MSQEPEDVTTVRLDVGVEADGRREFAGRLSRGLADSSTVHLGAHDFRRSAPGPMLRPLHLPFEAQQDELAPGGDHVTAHAS